MNTEVIKVEVEIGEIANHGYWVSGEVNTTAQQGEHWSSPQSHQSLDICVWANRDGDHRLDIQSASWFRVGFQTIKSARYDVVDHEFTIEELTQLRDVLTVFIDGLASGEITKD